LYYFYIFSLSLINAVIILKLSGAYKTMLVTIERVVDSILACRVVLHIREQGDRERKGLLPSQQITGPLCFARSSQETTDPNMTGTSEVD